MIQLFRKGPNFTNYQWEDTIQAIEGKAVSNIVITELCQFCRQKLAFNYKYKALFRGNFFIEDLAKFKLVTVEIIQALQNYLSWVL